ncbi:MAG: hypothetical protein J5742_02850 [Alphaproteobacteria bacterium]|nr:hypothetical protein [Alphaproteobacteria bacterium]
MKKILLTSIITIVTGITVANATDGDKKVTSKNYVDTAVATKQDVIDAAMLEITTPKGYTATLPTLVSYDNVDHLTGTKYGVVSNQSQYDVVLENESLSTSIPSMNLIHSELEDIYRNISLKQDEILRSGYGGSLTNPVAISSVTNGYLNPSIKGTGLVTKTDTDGMVGERKIFEASDVSGYHAQGLTQNEKDVQDISIPTVGAMMNAITNNQVTLPTGAAGNVVTYDSNGAIGGSVATYTGAAAYNATNDSAKIPTMAGVTNYAQAKKVCVGWLDGTTTPDSTHTDANCALWNLPD